MDWQDVAPLLKDSSARPFIPYNFLRDLDPASLQRLDEVLERHLVIDESKAMNGSSTKGAPVLCRYEGCSEVCPSTWHRGQHERNAHGKAKSNGLR